MATLKYLGIKPSSEVQANYHTKFAYSKTIHGKKVDYYECVLIEDLENEKDKINIKLIKELTKICNSGCDIFESIYN